MTNNVITVQLVPFTTRCDALMEALALYIEVVGASYDGYESGGVTEARELLAQLEAAAK